jgi:Na+/phosphate symporter
VRLLRNSGACTLGYALGDRSKALLSGFGVTTVLQSSTASLIVAAFAAGATQRPD